jgi:hypothetical protein
MPSESSRDLTTFAYNKNCSFSSRLSMVARAACCPKLGSGLEASTTEREDQQALYEDKRAQN